MLDRDIAFSLIKTEGLDDVGRERITREMAARDTRDRSRGVSPLRVPHDAIRIDTTDLTLAEQIAIIRSLYRGAGRHRGTLYYSGCRTSWGQLDGRDVDVALEVRTGYVTRLEFDGSTLLTYPPTPL